MNITLDEVQSSYVGIFKDFRSLADVDDDGAIGNIYFSLVDVAIVEIDGWMNIKEIETSEISVSIAFRYKIVLLFFPGLQTRRKEEKRIGKKVSQKRKSNSHP